MRRDLARAEFRSEFDGAQDYDLLLRISEKTDRIRHIPRVLYHWRRTAESTAHNIRRKPGALEAGRRAIEEHLLRRQENARVTIDWETHLYRVRWELPSKRKSLSLSKGLRLAMPSGFGRKQSFRILKSSRISRKRPENTCYFSIPILSHSTRTG